MTPTTTSTPIPSIVKANLKLNTAVFRHVNLVADNRYNKCEYMKKKVNGIKEKKSEVLSVIALFIVFQ